MSWEAAAGVLKPVAGPVASALAAKINRKFNPTELEKALDAGITAAQEQVDRLFLPCEQGAVYDFLTKFFMDCVVDELQKPLNDQGTPDIPYLVAAFQRSATEHPKVKDRVNADIVQDWMQVFVNTYLDKTKVYLKFQIARVNYLNRLADRLSKLHFVGISVAGQEDSKSEKLENIFVMPDVAEEATRSQAIAYFQPDLSLEKTISNRQVELWQLQQQRSLAFSDSQLTGRRFSAQQLLTQAANQKLVLLGSPGSGKTSLMRYFAMKLAAEKPEDLGLPADTHLLPILIRIRDLAQQPKIDILKYIQEYAQKDLQITELPTDCFKHWLKSGEALILLDGLDEVAQAAQQVKIVEQIESFLKEFDRNQAIITSRPAGYKPGFFRVEGLPHYEVLPFDDLKIELFINKWYDSRCLDKSAAPQIKNRLRVALANQDRLKLLAQNPLLLTIIALINRFEAELPKERHKLYEKAVETLLTAWDAGKELNYRLPLEHLKPRDFKRLMQQLAYWIHTQGSAGDRVSGTLIDEDELVKKLSQDIRERKKLELDEARTEARCFLDHIRDRAGLLEVQGKNCYAFVHKTFQEYLAAEDIDYNHDNKDDFGEVLQVIKQHLHDPHWREVLLLLVAKQKSNKAARAIQQILQQNSRYESWLHRDLFFAANCLAEDPADLQLSDADPSQEILEELVKLEISDSPLVSYKIREQVFQTLCSLGETEFATPALQLLKKVADQIEKVRFQEYRAALGEEQEALADLLELIKHKDADMRSFAAVALGELGNSSERVVDELLALLKDPDAGVRYIAAYALGKLGNSSERVVDELLALLQDPEARVRSFAADALGNLGKSSQRVVEGVLALLQDPVDIVRYFAAVALGNLGDSSDPVVKGVLALLQDPEAEVRYRAADALGKLGKSSERVVEGVLALLQDPDAGVRDSAAVAVGNLGKSSVPVVDELLALLQDPEAGVRYFAAHALGNLGNSSERVVDELLALLQEPEAGVRYRAADALGKLGKSSSQAIATVEKWIEQHQDSEYVRHGIDVLWDLVTGEQTGLTQNLYM